MKHLNLKHREQLARLLRAVDLEVDAEPLSAMLRHLDYVISVNETLNLTAIRDVSDAVRLHILDSLLAIREVQEAPPGALVDLGTGGGFPGVELALATGRTTLLVDSVGKKAAVIQRFLVQESLDSWISVSTSRAEELGRTEAGKFAVVTARALSALPSLVELAAPLLVRDGRLIALKGRPDDEEIRRGECVARLCGMALVSRRRVTLPDGGEQREILVFARRTKPQIALPRRVGLAQKQPLA